MVARCREVDAGRLLATILESNTHFCVAPSSTCHSSSRTHARLINDAGVADRCQVRWWGTSLKRYPKGGDAYILRNIIHDWDDDQAVAILTTCRRAMAEVRAHPGGAISPTIPTRHRWSFTPISRCSSTSAAWSARRTNMRRFWRAAVCDFWTISWDRAQRRWGITSSRRGPSKLERDGIQWNRCRAPGFSCSTTSAAPGGDDRRHPYRSRHDQAGLCTASKALASAIPPRAAPVNAEL